MTLALGAFTGTSGQRFVYTSSAWLSAVDHGLLLGLVVCHRAPRVFRLLPPIGVVSYGLHLWPTNDGWLLEGKPSRLRARSRGGVVVWVIHMERISFFPGPPTTVASMGRGWLRRVELPLALVLALAALSLGAPDSFEPQLPTSKSGADALQPVSLGISAAALRTKVDAPAERISDGRFAKHRWAMVAVLAAAALLVALHRGRRAVCRAPLAVHYRGTLRGAAPRAPPSLQLA